jgi:hypothetical protein
MGLSMVALVTPGPGIVLVLSADPGRMLASLPSTQGRVVNTWASDRIVQLHVDSSRDFKAEGVSALMLLRLPSLTMAISGCG